MENYETKDSCGYLEIKCINYSFIGINIRNPYNSIERSLTPGIKEKLISKRPQPVNFHLKDFIQFKQLNLHVYVNIE